MSTDPDIALVDAVLQGDDTAFEELIKRYQRPVTSLILRMTNNVNDAPDLAQRVFIKAYTKLNSFLRKSSFKTWLFTIAINIIRNQLRFKKRWGTMKNVEELDPGYDPDLESKLITEQRKRQLKRAIESLPAKQKAVLILRIYESMKFSEIATTLGMKENSAKVNFHHAVKKLQDML